jgi:hypothetical protein
VALPGQIRVQGMPRRGRARQARSGAFVILLLVSNACTEHARPTDLPTLELSVEPVVVIGTEAAEPHLLFGVTDAVRLPTGRIVVAHCGTSELRYFDPHGRHIRTVGGRGGGPGEFRRRVTDLFSAGADTVAVVEDLYAAFVAHFFDGQGDHVRSVRMPDGAAPKGRLDDGSLIAVRLDSHLSLSPDLTPRVDTIAATLLTLDASGAARDSAPGLFGFETEMEHGAHHPLRFGRRGVTAVLPDRIVY